MAVALTSTAPLAEATTAVSSAQAAIGAAGEALGNRDADDTTPDGRSSDSTVTVLVIGADHDCDHPQITDDYRRTVGNPIQIPGESRKFWVGNRCEEEITFTPDASSNWGDVPTIQAKQSRYIYVPSSGGTGRMCFRPPDGPCWNLVVSERTYY